MRVVQLSDIHLNKENRDDLRTYYMEALTKDLLKFHNEKEIDIILISGDLIDKGGESFNSLSGTQNPYEIFKEDVLNPILSKLDIDKGKVLMIPGNHDIERGQINEESEFFLTEKLTTDLANKRCEAFQNEFNNDNRRIQRFKDFEKDFHKDTKNYTYSNNESIFILEKEDIKLGFVLVNDSWRCSEYLKKEKHFIGYKQLLRAKNIFNETKTNLNIAVFHHPLNAINDDERDEIKSILKSSNYHITLFGHSHRYEADHLTSSLGGYLSINGRSAFSNPKELIGKYQPGYNIIDIDLNHNSYTLHARKYITARYEFDKDTDSLHDGIENGKLPQKDRLFPLAEDSNNQDKDLPDSYTADVDRIVSLLIGESIYPDKYAFVRELIQNSVDACNRIKEEHTHETPKIIINISSTGNYVEFIDQGDGMSKRIIKNNFSVLGKSISQEHNDNNGKRNLISKFGIGFISTFIAGEKVLIDTNSKEDGQIVFEIENVFKGFKYLPAPDSKEKSQTGTMVRVYLKNGFSLQTVHDNIYKYCRHIDNMEINYNQLTIKTNSLWNNEDSAIQFNDKNPSYETHLGISANPKNIIASYCGFLVSNYPIPIIPFRFPIHIGGEINFFPKSIDFDISRTNIIPTGKSELCRKDISLYLRKAFRESLERPLQPTYEFVVTYLHYYLQHFDSISSYLISSYSDFYSKSELVNLCSAYTLVTYKSEVISLADSLAILRSKGINTIYVYSKSNVSEYQEIVIQYLRNKDHLVISDRTVVVNFHDASHQQTNLVSVIAMISYSNGFFLQDISTIQPSSMPEMILDKNSFPEAIQLEIARIQSEYSVIVEISEFGLTEKSSINHNNHIFLNYNNEAFQSILSKAETMDSEILKVYLLGLLGLKLYISY